MAKVELRDVRKSYDGHTTVIHGIDLENRVILLHELVVHDHD